ncbi:MAG: hypothetical protein JWP45_2107 [Mucilaginibacter sp.]|nr:hypothetical protein [Mucilaginibacter sp.]
MDRGAARGIEAIWYGRRGIDKPRAHLLPGLIITTFLSTLNQKIIFGRFLANITS